jgi:hypothetical protein
MPVQVEIETVRRLETRAVIRVRQHFGHRLRAGPSGIEQHANRVERLSARHQDVEVVHRAQPEVAVIRAAEHASFRHHRRDAGTGQQREQGRRPRPQHAAMIERAPVTADDQGQHRIVGWKKVKARLEQRQNSCAALVDAFRPERSQARTPRLPCRGRAGFRTDGDFEQVFLCRRRLPAATDHRRSLSPSLRSRSTCLLAASR